MKSILLAALLVNVFLAQVAPAASLKLSIGIRETGGAGPAFSNGGATGGIEWVHLDGQTLVADGTWQKFTFTPTVDTLTLFAGASANGTLDTDWVTLEHIRILNFQGITSPIVLRLDDFANTSSSGSVVQGFEGSTIGTEVIFQEPGFSGSTAAFVTAGSSSFVTDTIAFAGTKSDEIKFQFVNATPTNWVRLTSSGTSSIPSPAMLARQAGFAPTISFYAMASVVPEPGAALLGGAAGLLLGFRRRK